MKKIADHEKYTSQLAAQAWAKISASKLAGGKKIGKCPKVVFSDLDDNCNGRAYPDHIELNISRLESPERDVFSFAKPPCMKSPMSPSTASPES